MRLGIKGFAEMVKKIQQNDNDCVTVITGTRGIGKSVCMMKTTEKLVPNYYTEEGFRKHNVYSRFEFERQLRENEPESVICVDEAITSLFKREFWLKEQNKIVKLLNMYRDRRHAIFILLPYFWDLDASVRNSLIVKFWVHIVRRGEGYIFTAEDNPFSFDIYNQKLNIALYKRGKIWQSPNYLSDIVYSDMPKEAYEVYKKVKAEKRAKADVEQRKPELTKGETIKAVLRLNPSVSIPKMAELLKVDASYAYDILKKEEKPIEVKV